MAQLMSKIFADVREYQNQARAAGFYHTTNLVLSYLHVQILASRHFDGSGWSGRRLVCVCGDEGRSWLLPLLSEGVRH